MLPFGIYTPSIGLACKKVGRMKYTNNTLLVCSFMDGPLVALITNALFISKKTIYGR